MHDLNFDHGFRKACPSGNHMLEDKIWHKAEAIINNVTDGLCIYCKQPINDANDDVCEECRKFKEEER